MVAAIICGVFKPYKAIFIKVTILQPGGGRLDSMDLVSNYCGLKTQIWVLGDS